MGIKYDQKTGKMFQSNIRASSLEKDRMEDIRLHNIWDEEEIKLNGTPSFINIFDIIVTDEQFASRLAKLNNSGNIVK